MAQHQEQLTFLSNTTILIVSSAGLCCVAAAVLWGFCQSPHWKQNKDRDDSPLVPWWKRLLQGFTFRAGDGRDQNAHEVEVDGALGGRTRVNRGGRERTKAARKEAKKRAKEEFKLSRSASEAQETRQRLRLERRKGQDKKNAEGSASRFLEENAVKEASKHSAEISRKLESYILKHKVSHLEGLGLEFGIPTTEVATRIEDLERAGRLMGIMVDSNDSTVEPTRASAYVRISLDEMRTLACFVNDKGRVSTEEFTREVNNVLKLSTSQEQGLIELRGVE